MRINRHVQIVHTIYEFKIRYVFLLIMRLATTAAPRVRTQTSFQKSKKGEKAKEEWLKHFNTVSLAGYYVL